jgi:hypothetical protein
VASNQSTMLQGLHMGWSVVFVMMTPVAACKRWRLVNGSLVAGDGDGDGANSSAKLLGV